LYEGVDGWMYGTWPNDHVIRWLIKRLIYMISVTCEY
jgi:hypothetical protein